MFDNVSPATLLLFVSCCIGTVAFLDVLFWYLIWREERRWKYVSGDGRRYCARQIKQGLLAAVGLVEHARNG